ncbi:hypothetical protein EJ377_02005 [Chryseobacterium arthrosphaerae]|uniref:Uncharacterized protein n=1 Tax=Chryseobacterium arthrosphaerae TaxID=651561 RepID=A0A432DYP5_9FLAO|nr:hypothetical protein EJ377_02005 [Chryseobacterium arthrosphaerae]
MSNPTTPGVSVEEIATLPHSVALIETAVPVFIGYTELVPAGNNKPLKSILFWIMNYFLESKKRKYPAERCRRKGTTCGSQAKFLMYYSFNVFANGGGRVIFFCRPYPSAEKSHYHHFSRDWESLKP